MPKLSLWNSGKKSNDYRFIDKAISSFFQASCSVMYIHKYMGIDENAKNDEKDSGKRPELQVQDLLFQENRDRNYATEVIELYGSYNVADNDFDLKQFGLFLTGDTLFIEFHLNDMIAKLGRKLMSGDVIELLHQRDDALLDEGEAINRFYVVDEGSRASDGYSSTWLPHVWRAKCSPMTGAQEYDSILDKKALDPFGREGDSTIRDIMTTMAREMEINEEIVEQARESVDRRYFDTTPYYVVPGEERGMQYPWVFAGDGVPPNGAELVGSGNSFPSNPQEGDWYLRTDYSPYALFQRTDGKWRMMEQNYREGDWKAAQGILLSFINNSKSTTAKDGSVFPERQNLSKVVVKPKSDL